MILRRILLRNGAKLCAVAVGPSAFSDMFKGEKWGRVKKIFEADEFGVLSPQLSCLTQTSTFTLFAGGAMGGFLEAREAYFEFLKNNEATRFTDHFEAKSQLQRVVALNFMKGGWYWGWRLSLFCGMYMTYITFVTTYRGDAQLWDFPLAGLVAGGLYRINLGLRGVIASATLGVFIGFFAGVLTMSVLKLTGKTLFDLQVQSQSNAYTRRKVFVDGAKVESVKQLNQEDVRILKMHDLQSDLENFK